MFAAINMKFYGKANLHLHLTLRDTLNQSETRPAAYFVFPHIFSIAVIYTVIMGLQPEILIKENIHTYKYTLRRKSLLYGGKVNFPSVKFTFPWKSALSLRKVNFTEEK